MSPTTQPRVKMKVPIRTILQTITQAGYLKVGSAEVFFGFARYVVDAKDDADLFMYSLLCAPIRHFSDEASWK